MHDLDLIITLAAALTAAFVFGFITQKLRLSPILGYLLAGIAIGPYTPGFIADVKLASQFAEIGVILLMFGVGLHFSIKDLLAVRGIAIPGAVGQSLLATALGTVLGMAFGWSLGGGLVLGLALSVASTVVLMRGLMDHKRLETPEGHIAVGWLVVEDIFTVLVLVLLPALTHAFSTGEGGAKMVFIALGVALLKLAILTVLMTFIGAKLVPRLLVRVARTRSSELFTLCVLVVVLVIATGSSAVFGVSMALGAFLAGMAVGQSPVSHQAAANALPMRDAFAVLFFVSVGMLFDPRFLLAEPWLVLGALAIILIGKPLAALAIVVGLGYSARTALTVAVGLAQIGEFSFILAELARRLGVLPSAGYSVLVAAALLSITLNPMLFRLLEPAETWMKRRRRLWAWLNRRAEARGESISREAMTEIRQAAERVNAIVVGYGPAGRTVTRILSEFGIRPIVVDLNADTIARLKGEGQYAIYGDAASEEILTAAGVEKARYLLITPPDILATMPVIVAARTLNANILIMVRARFLADRAMLEEVGATGACFDEAEAAVALAENLLRDVGAPQQRIDEESNKIREEFAVHRLASMLPEPEAPSRSLIETLTAGRIVLGIEAPSMAEAIRQAISRADDVPLDKGIATEGVLAREATMSTYLGRGVAFPHARLDVLSEPFTILARSESGVPVEGRDERARLLFIVLTSTSAPREQAQIVARIARLLENEALVQRLLEAKSPQDVLAAIREGEHP
ncbi:MAG: cation:proton antiporter [Planctomycetes bacterium]|nr:cation:proton antiporter [Planctomycetota bacterium]